MFGIIRKADIALLIFLAGVGILSWLVPACIYASADTGEKSVRITASGEVYGTYSLSEDNTIHVEQYDTYSDGMPPLHENVVVIHNGTVHMESADCRNQVCVHTGEISKAGESIICLPNKVVVEITGSTEKEGYDAISR